MIRILFLLWVVCRGLGRACGANEPSAFVSDRSQTLNDRFCSALAQWIGNAGNGWQETALSALTMARNGSVSNRYDGVSGMTYRVFGTRQAQTLMGAGAGRLVVLGQWHSPDLGFNRRAVCDALGRRLLTVNTPVVHGLTNSALTQTKDSIYCPQAECHELAVAVNAQRTWKPLGPDVNGRYGGMSDAGGLEAAIPETAGAATPVLSDAFGNVLGRLVSMTQRDTNNNGFNWTAVYDPLGRRLQTTNVPVASGVPLTNQLSTVSQFYDPQVEFLEVGVAVNGVRTWSVLGPDLNGRYGGMQGVGGLEATMRENSGPMTPAAVTPVVNDRFGNVLATINPVSPQPATINWSPTRVGGYGPVLGYQALVLSASMPLAETLVWRSRRIDVTGYYWLGARYYDPVAGRFLSPDPLGHGACMDLYSAFNGDPVDNFDPDGRCGGQNAAPPLRLGIAPEMRQTVGRSDYLESTQQWTPMYTGTGMVDANDAVAAHFWRVTEPTGRFFSYALDESSYAGPLLDPNYGETTRVPITTLEVENRQRVDFLMGELKVGLTIVVVLEAPELLRAGAGVALADAAAAETGVAAAGGGASAYEVGTYDALKARSLTGDALDIHHVGQASPMEQMIPGYDRATAPAIALPEAEHALIPTLRGTATMTPRDILANDIWNLRDFTAAPNGSLQQLIDLNKQMYPNAFIK